MSDALLIVVHGRPVWFFTLGEDDIYHICFRNERGLLGDDREGGGEVREMTQMRMGPSCRSCAAGEWMDSRAGDRSCLPTKPLPNPGLKLPNFGCTLT